MSSAGSRPPAPAEGPDEGPAEPSAACLWFVGELYHPETTGTGWFVTGLCEALATRRRVAVVCCQPNYAARDERAPRREIRHGVDIVRCDTPRVDTARLGRRLVLWMLQAWRMARALRRHVDPRDTVVVLTNPPLLPYVVRLLLRGRCRQLILYAQDLYPQALVCAGLLRPEGLAHRLLRRAARWLHASFAGVVVDGRDVAQAMTAQGLAASRVAVVPYWGEPGLASLRPSRGRRSLVIGHSGTLGRIHDIDTLLDGIAALRDLPGLRWVIRGSGPRLRDVRERVAADRLQAVDLLSPLPWSRLREVFEDVDVAIVTLARHARGVGTPSRVYNALSAGRPVIAMAEPDTELALLVRETGSGWVTPPGDAAALSALVRSLMQDPARVDAAAFAARSAAGRFVRARTVASFSRSLERWATPPA